METLEPRWRLVGHFSEVEDFYTKSPAKDFFGTYFLYMNDANSFICYYHSMTDDTKPDSNSRIENFFDVLGEILESLFGLFIVLLVLKALWVSFKWLFNF